MAMKRRKTRDEDRTDEKSKNTGESKESVTVGLLSPPDIPSKIAEALAPEFPDLLARYIEEDFSWETKVVVDDYIGAAEDASSILEEAEVLKKKYNWDYAICITDLPLFKNGEFLVAEANEKRKIAQISVPALGAVPLQRRVREAVLQLVSEMYYGSSEEARNKQEEKDFQMGSRKGKYVRNVGARDLVGKGLIERISPIHRVPSPESDNVSDVRFVARPSWKGYLRVTTGMALANRPWTIFTMFKSMIALAFGTGAYAMIFPTFWKLGDVYELDRSILLMVTALTALTAWIIISHGLWENSSKEKPERMTKLHNISTLLTLGFGVLGYYLMLVLFFFVAGYLFIPGSLLESNTGVGHPVGLLYHLSLAWLAASLSTCIGALGAGLENEETVLKGTYGYRQRIRKQKVRREQEEREKREEREERDNM